MVAGWCCGSFQSLYIPYLPEKYLLVLPTAIQPLMSAVGWLG
jgi:hypothetical protein